MAKPSMLSSLGDMMEKAEASLMPAIEEHVKNRAFDSKKDGLDFLEVKNSMLLSYLIDLTYHVRERISKKHDDEHFRRLVEMRTGLDKTRPLEKKMRHQLDKLLAATATSSSFAVGNQQDPLSYRPDPNSLREDEDSSDSDSDDGDDGSDVDDALDDLEAAQATLARARQKKQKDDDSEDEGMYRAPRMAAMPYPKEGENVEERQKRQNRKLRATELAQTLRAQYGEAPEQEDIHGGTELGKQREAARRLAEREAERTNYEEDNLMRLTTSRKDKKERKRLLREESSNLAAIADLGNLVRGVSSAFQENKEDSDKDDRLVEIGGRHSNGKRKRAMHGDQKGIESKNEFQQALFGGSGKSQKKQKKKKRR